jgi:hypothetical protein
MSTVATVAPIGDPPSNVGYGLVVWRASGPGVDGPDSDHTPDWVPPTGTVTFKPDATLVRDVSATPAPLTVLPDPVVGVLDEEGYLCTPVDPTASPLVPLYRGVWLVASDNPALNPTNVPYKVDYSVRSARPGGTKLAIPSDSIIVPSGAGVDGSGIPAVDLTIVGGVPAAPAQGIPAATALAAQAATDAATAQQAATDAATSAAAAEAKASVLATDADATVTGLANDETSEFAQALNGAFVLFRNHDGSPVAPPKVVALTLSADGTDIDDIRVYDSIEEVGS